MIRRPPRAERTYTLIPYPTVFRSVARRRRGFPALAGAASAVSFSPLPCEGRGGLGRGDFWIIRTVGTPSQPPPAFAGGGARAIFTGNVLLAADPRNRQAVLLERPEAGTR